MNEITLEPGWWERQSASLERERILWANWFRGEKSKGQNMDRDLESHLHEALGKLCVLTYAEPQTHEDAAKHEELIERFRAGERSPELLAEIEALTQSIKESET